MMFLNQDKLEKVVETAFNSASANTRWQTAIVKARQQLQENPYIHDDGDALLILSPSGEIYRANGTCGCKAFERGFPCWHRAAARIIERYHEA